MAETEENGIEFPTLRVINPITPLLKAPVEVIRNQFRHSHLVRNFVSRDIRLRYRNSIFGYLWTILSPLLLSAVYYFLFTIIAQNPEPKYPLYVLVGVITWGLFSSATNDAVNSLVSSSNMIKQVYFPRELFASTKVMANLIVTSLSMLVVIPFIIKYDIIPDENLLLVPLGLILTVILALGLGLLLSPLNVVHRDVGHFIKFVTRAGFFLSPVMWTLEMAGSRSSILDFIMLNPMVVPLTMVRKGIEGEPLGIEMHWVLYSVGFAIGIFLLGAIVFKRQEAKAVKYL